ncbi:methyltransferase domain-containing protein [Rossellomorea oryzaecorticis]|uniref:Methyltransferase domain-containing protein n=1 Tax=Rossellomorea oryzaecorticis TaxID=1396505 RepID=A0ABU9KEB6_9BACI
MDVESLTINKQSWDEVADRFFGRNPLPEYGPLAPSEEELNLFGDVTNLKVLEIGCGSGHSLQYMDQKNAGELWGLDLSGKQIDAAKTLLKNCNSPLKLFESPMEDNPGLPTNYFDIVFSIYALGWTTNLEKTLANVNKYLKRGGIFIFSWEHPIYNRVSNINGTLTFNKSYHEEGSYYHEAWGHPAIMQQFRMSTYINTLINNGFKVERVVEDVCLSDEDIQRHSNRWYSYEKAKVLPTAVIIKSVKL